MRQGKNKGCKLSNGGQDQTSRNKDKEHGHQFFLYVIRVAPNLGI